MNKVFKKKKQPKLGPLKDFAALCPETIEFQSYIRMMGEEPCSTTLSYYSLHS